MSELTQNTPIEPVIEQPVESVAPASEPVNPYLAVAKARLGKALSPDEATIAARYRISPDYFGAMYGAQAKSLADKAVEDVNHAFTSAKVGDQGSLISADSARNLIKGITTGTVNLAEGVTNILPVTSGVRRDLQNSLRKTNKNVTEAFDAGKSYAEKAANESYRYLQDLDDTASQFIYETDIDAGADPTMAKLQREGRNAVSAFKNSLLSGEYREDISTNAGSMIPTLLGTKGLGSIGGGLAKGTGYLTARVLEKSAGARRLAKAAEAVTKSADTAALIKGVKEAAPWMISNALIEGGSAVESVYDAAEGISVDQLYERSPEFVNRLMQKIQALPADQQDNLDLLKTLEDQTRQELIDQAAHEAGIQHGINAGLTSWFTKGMGKWATPEKLTTNKLLDGVKDFVLDAGVEEPVTEISAAYTPAEKIRKYLDQAIDPTRNLGEAAGKAVLSTAGIGTAHALGSGTISALNQGKEAIDEAREARREKVETQSIIDQSSSIRGLLEANTTGLADAGSNLQATRDAVTSKFTTDANGKTQLKTAEDHKKDLESLNQSIRSVQDSVARKDLSEEETQRLEAYKSTVLSKLQGMRDQVMDKLAAPAIEVLSKMQNAPEGQEHVLTEKDSEALANYMSLSTENQQDQFLHEAGFTEKQLASLSQSQAVAKDPKLKKVIDDYIQNTKTITRGAPVPPGANPPANPPKPNPGSSKNKTSFMLQDSQGRHNIITVDTDSSGDLAFISHEQDASGNNVSRIKKIKDFADSPEKQTVLSVFADPNSSYKDRVFALRKFMPIIGRTDVQVHQDLSSIAHADTFEASINGASFAIDVVTTETGEAFTKDSVGNFQQLSNSTAQIFTDPSKTTEDKRAALEQYFNDFYKNTGLGHIDVKDASTRHAIDLLYSDKISEAQHGLNILKAQNKTVSINPDTGELEIEDLDTEEKNKEVTEKLGKLGDKVQIVKRNLYLMGKDSPFAVLKNLLVNPEKFKELMKANKVTNINSLVRKLFTSNDTGMPTDLERTFIDRNASLASQILSMLNTDGQFIKTFMPVLEASMKDSEALKDIVTKDGEVTEEFKQFFAIAATAWLANLDARRTPLTEDLARKYGIDPRENQKLLDNAHVHGCLAPAAVIDLASSLKRMMGVVTKDDANPDEVDALFGEMAGRLCDSLIDAGILEDVKQTATRVTYDTETYKEKREVQDVHFLRIKNKDYSHLFRESSDILNAILNPRMQNVIHYAPPEVNDSIVGTPAKAGDAALKPLEKANNTAHTVNPLMTKLALALGATGLSRILHPTANGTRKRLYSVGKTWETNEGRTLTSQLGLDTISAIINDRPEGTSVADTKVYFDNRVIKNGRIYQQGMATYQSNPLLRHCLMVTDNKAVNLKTDKDSLNAWKITLAQKLGQNVSGNHLSTFEAQVDHALTFMEKLPEPAKKLLEKINNIDLEKGQVQALTESEIDILQELIDSFNQDQAKAFGDKAYAIGKEESINALLEMYRYHTEDKTNFVPHIFLEIDGISDGPAYINRLFGIAVTSMTPEFIRTLAETGFIPLIKATSQDLLTEGTKESKLFGTGGFNLHAKVGASLVDMFAKRIGSLKDTIKNSRDDISYNQSTRALKSTVAALELMKIVGLLSGDVQAFVDGKADAIKFHKNISKKLSTIILYGSGLRGTTGQIIDMLFDGAYGKDGINGKLSDILNRLAKHYNDPDEAAKARKEALKEYRKIRKVLIDLFGTRVEKEMDFSSGTYSYTFSETDVGKLDKNFPQGEDLDKIPSARLDKLEDDISELMTQYVTALPRNLDASTNWDDLRETNKGEVASKDATGKYTVTKDKIQNFALTDAGTEALIQAFMPVIGEPAYAAVVDAVGKDALTAAKTPQIFGSLSNGVSRMDEILNKRSSSDRSQSRRFIANQKRLNKLAPSITFKGGARIIAERRKYVPSEKPVYEGKHGASTYFQSQEYLDDIGVAFGALSTQGLGDTSTAYHLLRATDGIFGQVFDGMYTAITKLAEISRAANEGAKNASTQRPIQQISDKIISIGKELQKVPRYEKYDPKQAFSHAVADMVNGILPDGTKLTEGEQRLFEDVQYQMTRSLTQYVRDVTFDPSIFAGRKIIFSNKQHTEVGIDTKIRNLVDEFFDIVDNMAVNERINHQALESLPQTFHHMSGATTPFTQGNVIDATKGQELLDKVNKKLSEIGGKIFKDLPEFLSAYIATEAEEIAKKLLDDKKITQKEYDRWLTFTHRTQGNDHVRTLPAEVKALADAELGEKVKHTNAPDYTPRYGKNVQLPSNAISNAILAVGTFYKSNAIFNNIFQKLLQVVPRNVPVFLYENISDMPAEVRGKFTNAHQGIFFNGQIHILDQSGSNQINALANQKVIVHELIHATLTMKIQRWADGDKTVPVASRMALNNLDNMIQDLFNNAVYSQKIPPALLMKFKEIVNIKDKAERVDEALAHILSNYDLYNEISKLNFSDKQIKTHRSNLFSVFKKLKALLSAAVEVWKRLLGIAAGTPMDKILDLELKGKNFDKYKNLQDFLSVYGMNTLVLLDNPHGERYRTPDEIRAENEKAFEEAQKNGSTQPVRSSISLTPNMDLNYGLIGYLESTDDFTNLRAHSWTDTFFNNLAAHPREPKLWWTGLREESIRKASKEVEALSKYSQELTRILSNINEIVNPEEVARLITDFQKDSFFTPDQRKDLTKNYTDVISKLDPYFMVKDRATATHEELDRSAKIYSLLTGSDPVLKTVDSLEVTPETLVHDRTGPTFRNQAVFYALAFGNPEINNALGRVSISPDKLTENQPKGSLARVLEKAGNLTLKVLQAKTKEAQSTKDLLKSFENQNANIPTSTLYKVMEKISSPLDSATMQLMLAPILLGKGVTYKNVIELAKVLRAQPVFGQQAFNEWVRGWVNKTPVAATEFLKEFYGRVPSNTASQTMLKSIKGYVDKTRKANLDTIPQELLKAFKRKLKLKNKKLLHRVITSTKACLLDFKKAVDFITDTTKLNKEIKDLEQKILASEKTLGKTYLAKTRQLANFNMGTGIAGQNLLVNPEAIAHLWDEETAPRFNIESPSQELIDNIKNLLILYQLQYLPQGDRLEIAEYAKNDLQGLEKSFNAAKETLRLEGERVKNISNKNWQYNYRFNWFPKGNVPRGSYRLVTESKLKELERKGYKDLGVIPGSELEGEPIHRIYDAWNNSRDVQEGIFQCINQTAFGWQLDKNGSNEFAGATILDPILVERIKRKAANQKDKFNYIPIRNSAGKTIGYERVIPKADREDYVDGSNDIFSGIAQYRARQDRETIAKEIMVDAGKILKSDYDNATEADKKTAFEDIFHSKNKQIQRAVARLDHKTKERLEKIFGKGHCYIRKDEVWTYLGYYKMSIGDMWDGDFIFSKKTSEVICFILDSFVPNGKARAYLTRAESLIMGAATWSRESIIIRSGIVPLMNAVGNALNLMTSLKIPPNELWRLFRECYADTETYNRLHQQELALSTELLSTLDPKKQQEIKDKIAKIQLEYKNLPIYSLIEAGEYSTIDSSGTTYESIELIKHKANNWLEAVTNDKIPTPMKTFAKNVLMTKDSEVFQALAKLTNYGDWLAKAIGYRYLTEKSKYRSIPMKPEIARNIVATLFVDYDQFVGPIRDWANRVGMTWFMTFTMRMVTACQLSLLMSPGTAILGSIFSSAMNLPGTPLTDNFFSKLVTGRLGSAFGLDMFFRGVQLYPLAILLGI